MQKQTNSGPVRLVLEGNIGAGKSTLLRILKEQRAVEIIPEPTAQWQNVTKEGNLLDLFYKDIKRWAYTFQSNAFITRVQSIYDYEKKQTHKESAIYVYERSIYCDRFCFAKNCHEQGFMNDLEWHIYKDWFLWLSAELAPIPHGFIYLRTEPETAHARIQMRRRSEENEISLSYLSTLHQKHEEWLIESKVTIPHIQHVPVLVLDCNGDFEHDVVVQQVHLSAIDAFIATHGLIKQQTEKEEKRATFF